jgi:hypothetical protein
MIEITLTQHPEVKALVRAAFPDYKKKTVTLVDRNKCELYGTYWDGGTRYEYVAVDLTTKRSKGAPQYRPAEFGGPKTTPVVHIPPGVVIVQGGVFCGRTARAKLYVHPSNMTKLLPTVTRAASVTGGEATLS